MSDRREPGSTLEMLIDRYEFLDRLKKVLRKRFETEDDYLKKLESLRTEMDDLQYKTATKPSNAQRLVGRTPTRLTSQRFDPTILLLLSPLIALLDQEIQSRKTTNKKLRDFFHTLPSMPHPNDSLGGTTPKKRYEDLTASYKAYQNSYAILKSQESIYKLQKWYKQPRPAAPVTELSQQELASYRLPAEDWDYRNKVLIHSETAASMRVWHRNAIPKRFDACQERFEQVKSLIMEMLENYSSLNTGLVRTFSAGQVEVSKISSVNFVSPVHASKEVEDEHPSFQDVQYRNFYTEMGDYRPLFGTVKALQIAFRILEKRTRLQIPDARLPPMPPLSILLSFETDDSAVARTERGEVPEWPLAIQLLIFIFLCSPPYYNVQRDVKAKGSFSRSSEYEVNISNMDHSSSHQLDRTRWTQYLLAWERLNIASALLTHSQEAGDILSTSIRNVGVQRNIQNFKEVWTLYDPDETGYVEYHKIGPFLASLRGEWDVRIHPGPQTVASIMRVCAMTHSSPINHRHLVEHLTNLGHKDTAQRRDAYNILYWEVKLLCQLSEARVIHVVLNRNEESQKGRGVEKGKGFSILQALSQFKTVTKKFFLDRGISFQDMLILLLRYDNLTKADGNISRALREHVAMDKIQSFCQMIYLRKRFREHMERKKPEQVETVTSNPSHASVKPTVNDEKEASANGSA